MITICLVNEARIDPKEFEELASDTEAFIPEFAIPWEFGQVDVTVSNTAVPGAWNVFIGNKDRHPGAAGWHDKDATGTPFARILPGTSRNRFGTYRPARSFRGRVLWGEYTRAGTLGVICHEVAEMLGDPLLETVSMPDHSGHQWLREIADPVYGVNFARLVNGRMVVYPDIVLPSFYDLAGVGPYSIANSVTGPFTIISKAGYGFWRNLLGKFIKV